MMREQVIFLKSPHMEHWITMVLYIYIFSSWLYKDHQQTRTLKKCSSREKMNTYWTELNNVIHGKYVLPVPNYISFDFFLS